MTRRVVFLAVLLSILVLFAGPSAEGAETIFRPGPGLNNGTDNGSANAGKDTLVHGSEPARNFGSEPFMVGTPRSTCNPAQTKAYIQFDLSSLPADVEQVFLGVTHFSHTASCVSNCNANFYFYPVEQPWNEMSLSYNAMPSEGAAAYGPVNITFPNSLGNKEYDITNIYRSWKNGPLTNNGLAIYSPTSGCNNAAVMFNVHSSDDPDVNTRPYLRILSSALSLQAPQNLRYTLNGNMLTIQWNASSGASGYKAGLGFQSGNYSVAADVGNITQFGPFDISAVAAGTYYLAVKAYSATQESGYSNEIAVTITATTALQAPRNMRYVFDYNFLTINWDAVSGAAGYRLGLGGEPGKYSGPYEMGNTTQLGPLDVMSITPATFYLASKAYTGAKESGYSNEIAVPLTGRAGDLTISQSSDPLQVSGTYKGNGAARSVNFSATSEGNGRAKASYTLSDGSAAVSVDLQGEEKATLTWKGKTIDGSGALSQEEAVAIRELASGDLGKAIALVPLDLGCLAGEKDRAAIAALLMPWQSVLKYTVPNAAEKAREVSRGSACSYYDNRDAAEPVSGLVHLSDEDPVPNVYGYFPFDEHGAAEVSSPAFFLRNAADLAVIDGKLYGTCGTRCRGACGGNCDPDSCTKKEEISCIKDEEDKMTGEFTRFSVYECGGHAGCEWHDDCFDECLRKYGCGSWGASVCMHNTINGCDRMAASFHGLSNCISWARGFGPYDKKLVYKYAEETGDDPELCSNGMNYQGAGTYDVVHQVFVGDNLYGSCTVTGGPVETIQMQITPGQPIYLYTLTSFSVGFNWDSKAENKVLCDSSGFGAIGESRILGTAGGNETIVLDQQWTGTCAYDKEKVTCVINFQRSHHATPEPDDWGPGPREYDSVTTMTYRFSLPRVE